MKLAIIEGGGANFLSVTTALERLGVKYDFTHDSGVIQAADAVVLPGVGNAAFAMQVLQQYNLVNLIKNITKPFLGICLGMQLLYQASEESTTDAITQCLGVIPGVIKKFVPTPELVVPHMGWNNLLEVKNDKVISGLGSGDNVYFVHSYYAPINQATIAACEYIDSFTAVAKYNNFYGMQFHPEKSGVVGAKLLNNFLDIVNNH